MANTNAINVVDSDIAEFITYGLTQPKASSVLKNIMLPTAKKQTAWSKFTTLVGDLIGLKQTNNEVSAFMALLNSLDSMLDADFRRDEALVDQLAGISTGRWDPMPDPDDIPNDDVPPKNIEDLMGELADITTPDTPTPLKVTSFETNNSIGTPAYGLQLTADNFAGDTTRHHGSQQLYTMYTNDVNLQDALQKLKSKGDIEYLIGEHALRIGAEYKVESGNPTVAKRMSLIFIDEVLNGKAPDVAQRAKDFINALDYSTLQMKVIREADSFTFYNEQHLLKILPETMSEQDIDLYVENPSDFISPAVVAKLKAARTGLWSEFTDHLDGLALDKKGNLNKTPNLYTWLADKHGAEKASAMLNDAGIKGLISNDQTNYTLFDPVKIQAIIEAGKSKPERPDNLMSTAALVGKTTPETKEQVVRQVEEVSSIIDYLYDIPSSALTSFERQQMNALLSLFNAASKPLISARDSSTSFGKLVLKLEKQLYMTNTVANKLINETVASDPVVGRTDRLVFKSKLIESVMGLPTYTPLQSRIRDIMAANLTDEFELGKQRAEWLIEDLSNSDIAAAMMQVQRNSKGAALDISGAVGVAEKVLAHKREVRGQSVDLVSGGSIDQLRIDIPNKERVFKKPLTGAGPILKENGTRFIDSDLTKPGQGLAALGIDQTVFSQVWQDAVDLSADKVREIIATKGLKKGKTGKNDIGGKVAPKDIEFWERALQLPDQARFWYEISSEAMVGYLPDLTPAQVEQFFLLVGATSPQADPNQNMKRAISLLGLDLRGAPAVTAIASKAGTKGGAVRDAILKVEAETNKIHNFAGTFLYLAGMTKQAPLSTNDRQVASSFNMHHEQLFANQGVYYTLSQFYLGLADELNSRLPKDAEPYQAWQLQALGWVQERIDKDKAKNKESSPDDYMLALQRVMETAAKRKLLPEGQMLTNDVLTNPAFQWIVDPTTPAFLRASKTNIPLWSDLSPKAVEAKKILGVMTGEAQAKFKGEVDAILRRTANKIGEREESKSGSSVPSKILGALSDKAVDVTRVDHGEVAVGDSSDMTIRIPFKSKDSLHINAVLAALNSGLRLKNATARHFEIMNEGDAVPEGRVATSSAFVKGLFNTDLTALGKNLPKGMSVNVSYVPNGMLIDIVPADGAGMAPKDAVKFFDKHIDSAYDIDVMPTAMLEFSSSTQTTDTTKMKAEMNKHANQVMEETGVTKSEANRFLQGSNYLLTKFDKKADSLYNIRNSFASVASKLQDSVDTIAAARDSLVLDTYDYILGADNNAKLTEVRKFLKSGKTPEGLSNAKQKRYVTGRNKFLKRLERFDSAVAKTNSLYEQQQEELTTAIDIVKIRNAKPIAKANAIQSKLSKRVALDPIDVHDGLSTSFIRDQNVARLMFDSAQAHSVEQIATLDSDERMDIKAGRQAKEANRLKTRINKQINEAELPPETQVSLEEAQEAVDAIIAKKPFQKSTRQNITEYTADFFTKDWWRDQWHKLYQYWVSDVAAIERLEKMVNKIRYGIDQRFEGSSSATILTMQAKNALVAASIPNHVSSVRLEDGQLVIDDSIDGLEKLLEPIKNLGDEALRMWEAYMAVQRAKRLTGVKKEKFISEENIAIVEKYVEQAGLQETFETAANKWQELNRSILQVAVDSGYINNEDAFGGFVVKENIFDAVGELKGTKEHTKSKNRAFKTQAEAEMEVADMQLSQEIEQQRRISEGLPLLDTSEFEAVEREGWYHDDYVPFYRVNEIDAGVKPGRSQGTRIGEVRKGVTALRGGIGQLNIIENMSKNISFLISGSLKTVAMKKVADLGNSIAMEKIQVEGEAPLIEPAKAKEILGALGIELEELSIEERQRWIRMLSRASSDSRDTVTLFEDGRPTYYKVTDPLLMDALKQVGVRETVSWLHKLGMVTRVLTKSITIMPGFLVRNFVRETQNTYVIDEKASKRGYSHLMRALKNVWNVAKNPQNETMLAMMAAGAVSYDNYFDARPEAFRKNLAKEGVDKKGMKRITGSIQSAWQMYMRMAVASEHANRLSVRDNYIDKRTKELQKDGVVITPAIARSIESEANYRALDVLNFSRRGAGLGADLAIAVLPFINPRIQGMDRLLRGSKENFPNFAMKMGLMSMAAMALAAKNWEDNEEEMERLKDTDKDLFYHFFWTNPDGTKDHWRMPKGFEIGQLAGTFPERIIEQLNSDNAEPMDKTMLRFLKLTFGIQTPQTIKPILEVTQNYDSFRQRPILNFGMQFKPAHMQYDSFTSHTVKDIAQSMPEWAPEGMQSPKYLQHLIQGYFGPIGSMLLEGGDTLYRATGNAPDLPKKEIGQRYLIRDYYRGNVEYSTKALDYFYEMLAESGKVAAGLKQMKDERDPRYKSERIKNRELLRARKDLNRTSKRLTRYSKRIKEIYESETITPEDKFEEIQRLTAQRNIVANKAMKEHWEVFY